MSEPVRQEPLEDFKQVRFGPKTRQIPEDWKVARLGDNTYLKGRIGWHGLTEDDHQEEGDYFLVTGTDFEDGRVQWDRCVYVNEEWYERDPNIQLEEADLLVTKDGSIGKTALIDELPGEATLNNGLFVLRPLNEEYAPEFMYYVLKSFYFDDFIETITAGSTISHLYQKDFVNFRFPLPNISEQRRIADILSTVDKQIQQTNEIIEETKELKRGLRQDLVVGSGLSNEYTEVRLGARTTEIPVNWSIETISDVADVEKGNTPKTSNSDYYGGDIVWVTPDDLSNLYERGEKYISDSRRKLTEAGLKSTSVNIVPAPSVMFTSRSYGIGKTAICTTPAATNQGIIAFHCKDELDVEYLYYYLNYVMDYIIALSGVSTFPEVSLTDIRNLKVPVPPKEDQNRIKSVLQSVDEKLVDERGHKEHLQELKRGLMQDLLTGDVRVDPTD
ncbi:type I restriction endonuclease subunit S [Halobacterium sp. DL1]|jgi:type I restriction enzyme S subunit|nr:type I restriction endonuclease subunit S [Halobacterium sp. DL1]